MKYLIAAILLPVLLLIGCATSGRPIDMTKVSEIEKGVTTRAEVETMFGAPQFVSMDGFGNTVATWTFVRVKSAGKNFIPVVSAFSQSYDQNMQQLIVTFDQDGVVKSFTSNESNSQINSGIGS